MTNSQYLFLYFLWGMQFISKGSYYILVKWGSFNTHNKTLVSNIDITYRGFFVSLGLSKFALALADHTIILC